MRTQIEELVASKVFAEDVTYTVPMYQRNFAWGEEQVQRLLEDINGIDLSKDESGRRRDANYYLGMLVVDQSKTKLNHFEVIDGQQRLTSLYLLITYLKNPKKCKPQVDFKALRGQLEYEARKSYRAALVDPANAGVSEIKGRYETIAKFFEGYTDETLAEFCKKLDSVFLLRVQVPEDVDLNHYFEIMNTRGEQLEPHQIAKARVLGKLKDKEDTKVAAMIWDACSEMDSYVQMNFPKSIRSEIFGEDWNSCVLDKDWSQLVKDIKAGLPKADSNNHNKQKNREQQAGEQPLSEQQSNEEDNNKEDSELQGKTLLAFLSEKFVKPKEEKPADDKEEKTRFESILSFPNFLLQVKAVDSYKEGESSDAGNEDPSLDDKKLLDLLEDLWKADTAEPAKKFLVNMLKRRFLFDKYILKREFARDFKSTGRWSLKKLKRYPKNEARDQDHENYVNTFGEDSTVDDSKTKKLRNLQSAMRITFTSPKSMRWITKVLKYLDDGKNLDKPEDLTRYLETYCLSKIKEADYKNRSGFGIERIVFSYLDYLLLYSDKYKDTVSSMKSSADSGKGSKEWEFQFRTSIEHFFPQHPRDDTAWDEVSLNCFGNLALISDSGNSELSNVSPTEKIKRKSVINQSIKLKIMADITDKNKDKQWSTDDAENHGKEMMEILDKEYPDN